MHRFAAVLPIGPAASRIFCELTPGNGNALETAFTRPNHFARLVSRCPVRRTKVRCSSGRRSRSAARLANLSAASLPAIRSTVNGSPQSRARPQGPERGQCDGIQATRQVPPCRAAAKGPTRAQGAWYPPAPTPCPCERRVRQSGNRPRVCKRGRCSALLAAKPTAQQHVCQSPTTEGDRKRRQRAGAARYKLPGPNLAWHKGQRGRLPHRFWTRRRKPVHGTLPRRAAPPTQRTPHAGASPAKPRGVLRRPRLYRAVSSAERDPLRSLL